MSDNVVTEPSNPTGEDMSLDNAINDLYVEQDTPSDDLPVPATDATLDTGEELESTETDENVDTPKVDDSDDSVDSDKLDDNDDNDDTPDVEDGVFNLPEHMPKELREKLEGLSEDVQKASTDVFKQMHKSYTKKNQNLSKQSFLAESVDEAFKKHGMNVDNVKNKATIISNYVAFDKMLRLDPVKAIKLVAERHKIKPDQLGESPTKTEKGSSDLDTDLLTENEKLLVQKLEAANDKIDKLEQNFDRRESQEQLTAVQRFMKAEDESGNLLHPHFTTVKNDMMDLAEINPNMTIEQLYKKAVRMNDDLYAETIKTERQKIVDENKRKKDERLKKAKAMSRQSLKQNGTQTIETLDEDAMLEKIAVDSGFN